MENRILQRVYIDGNPLHLDGNEDVADVISRAIYSRFEETYEISYVIMF